MAETIIVCRICSREVEEGTAPKLSNFPIKTDENSIVCNECKLKTDEEHQTFIKNEIILKTEDLPQSFSSENFLTTIENEFVEVPVKNESMLKEEDVDTLNCDEESESSDLSRDSQEKTFRCNFCDYSSSWKHQLKSHMYKHSGEKPFKCDKCDYRCCRKSDLSQHNEAYNIEENCLNVDFCDILAGVSNLNTHMYKTR
ncbi:hypothetical protein FQR65_LT12255 [Abscondita terminalis]|nr:hypothetical protein FQR65_LT12255 [Abscondita terminalis]